jgi:hypothetical protein
MRMVVFPVPDNRDSVGRMCNLFTTEKFSIEETVIS